MRGNASLAGNGLQLAELWKQFNTLWSPIAFLMLRPMRRWLLPRRVLETCGSAIHHSGGTYSLVQTDMVGLRRLSPRGRASGIPDAAQSSCGQPQQTKGEQSSCGSS